MKNRPLYAAATAAALSLSLVAGTAASASAAPTAPCHATGVEGVDYFNRAMGEIWDREELAKRSDWFGNDILPGLAAEGVVAASMITPEPQRVVEFFNGGVQAAFEEFRLSLEQLADRVEAAGGHTAEDIREFNVARYTYALAITNGFADAFNADRVYDHASHPDWDDIVGQFFYATGRLIYGFEPDVGGSFGRHARTYPVSQAEIRSAFSEITDEWVLSGASPAEAEAKARETMTAAMTAWVEQQTLTSLEAFQVGARLNLDTAMGLGYVVELEGSNGAVLSTPVNHASTRPMALRDLASSAPSQLLVDDKLLFASLDASGAGFRTPEEITGHAYVREVVEETLDPLDTPATVSPNEFAAAVQEVVETQLSEAHTLAGDFDDVPVEFPHLLDDFTEDYLSSFDDLETRELKRLPDWRDESGALPYDKIRADQFDVIPFTALREHGVTSVSRAVRYSSVDGAQLSGAPEVHQVAEFCSTKHLLTGETRWSDTALTLPAVTAPTAAHPAPNATLGAPSPTVEAIEVTPADIDLPTAEVVFPVSFTIPVRHVDETGAALPASLTAGNESRTGAWGTTEAVSALKHDDWTLTSQSATQHVKFTADQPAIVFTYRKATASEGTTVESTPVALVETGASGSFTWQLLAAALVFAGAAAAGWQARRRSA
ncbi:MucBP domain-containing protein [Leucobacter albus]|uniref:MucBP domain-containing protein n=1 Tax=Leucobacter albus TaxID=272210 RepID=A0ABW3TSG5_9MICO